jgi:hypothetical protein
MSYRLQLAISRRMPLLSEKLLAVRGQPAAELVQRAGAGEQQGVAFGEAGHVPGPPEVGVDGPAGRVVQVDQAHLAARYAENHASASGPAAAASSVELQTLTFSSGAPGAAQAALRRL